jgi:hypothetical protein
MLKRIRLKKWILILVPPLHDLIDLASLGYAQRAINAQRAIDAQRAIVALEQKK